MASELPRPVAALLRRLTELSEQDQLLAYEAIRDYLAGANPSIGGDAQLDGRLEALRVMRAVVEHYRLEDPRKLGVKQFDEAPEEIREGWRSGQIIRVFAKWGFARDALAGARPRETTRQRALRSRTGASRLQTDDYLASVRDWLATKPPKTRPQDYDGWVSEQRVLAFDGKSEPLVRPRSAAIKSGLGVFSWEAVVRMARDELSLKEAKEIGPTKRRRPPSRMEHDLVSVADASAITGRSIHTIKAVSRGNDFPTAVLLISGARYYFRSDIEAYFKSKPFPRREHNELRGTYISRHDAATMAGLTSQSFHKTSDRPPPVAQIGGRNIWLRSEVEAWVEERERRPEIRRAEHVRRSRRLASAPVKDGQQQRESSKNSG